MNKKILAVGFVFLCLTIGYATLARADVTGKATPVITQSFASTKRMARRDLESLLECL